MPLRIISICLITMLCIPATAADCPRPSRNDVNELERWCSCMGGTVQQNSQKQLYCANMRSSSSAASSSTDAASQALANGLMNLLGGLLSPPRNTNTVSRSWALNQQGIWAYDKRDWYKARDKFAAALAIDPNDPIIRRNLANTWAWIADDAMKTYDYRRAIQGLRQAMNADPSLQDNRDWLDRLERQLNEDERAARARADKQRQDAGAAQQLQSQTSRVLAGMADSSSAVDSSVVDLRFMGNKPLIVDPATVSGVNPSPKAVPANIAEAAVVLPSLEERMDAARNEIAGLQEALRRIDRSGKLNEQERIAWQKEMDDAGKRALKHGVDMLPGLLIEVADERVKKAMLERTGAIRELLDKRISAIDPAARSEFDAQIKILDEERDILKGSANVLKLAEVKVAEAQAEDIRNSTDPDVSKKVLAAHMAFSEMVKSETVQKALKITGDAGKKYSMALTYGKDAIDSVFDVASQLVALKQMNGDLTTNSEQYLATVNNLSQKLCRSGARLVALKKEAGVVPPETKEPTCGK